MDWLQGLVNTLLVTINDNELARAKSLASKTINRFLLCIEKSEAGYAGKRVNQLLNNIIVARDAGTSTDGPDTTIYTHSMNSYLSNKGIPFT